jgi:hypothetical protein
LIDNFEKNIMFKSLLVSLSNSFIRLIAVSIVFLAIGFSTHAQNNALAFDGVGDKVIVANNSALNFSTGTVESWVKPGVSSSQQGFLMMRTSVSNIRWSAHISQATSEIGIYNGTTYKTVDVGTISVNTWYHVALVFSGSNTLVYVNGVFKGSTGNGINTTLTNIPFSIGNNDAGYPAEDFLGSIDEVRIWNTARTQSEIQTNMNTELSTATGLIANYHFNQGTAGGTNAGVTSLTDASGNNNTGTLSSFALTGATSNWVASGVTFPSLAITSFSPLTGNVGASVTITGTNFNTTASNNIVFFGATKATVSAATATSLTVTVPSGATYAPITVLNTGTSLAAYSLQKFNPTFSPSKSGITSSDFDAKLNFDNNLKSPSGLVVGDLDGDGMSDIIVTNGLANNISVYLNTSSTGTIGYSRVLDIATGSNNRFVAIGDLDGDGKPDLVVVNEYSTTISVIRNTSTTGVLSFDTKVDFTTGANPSSVAIGDIDGDGKLDLAVANINGSSVSVFHNTSTTGSLVSGSFAAKVDFLTGNGGNVSVALADLDGDGKPELAVVVEYANVVAVWRNTATSGKIDTSSFSTRTYFTTGAFSSSMEIGDLDGDGKLDLAVVNGGSANTISVLRNTFTKGSIGSGSFVAKVDFATGTGPNSVAIADIDGDGMPDLTVVNNGSKTVSVLRNTATSGSIVLGSFAAKVDLNTGINASKLVIGDLDGDGKPDLVVANTSSSAVSILRNLDPLSSNANLSGLTTTAGALNTPFATGTTTYSTADVSNATTSITVTPTKSDANASIQVRVNAGTYATVTSGSSSSPLTLNVGSNTVDVKVTAQDGSTIKTYTLTVTREMAPPGNALNFDGSNDYVSLGDRIEGFTTITFEAWVNHRTSGNWDEICSKAFVNSFGITSDNRLWFHLGTGSTWFAGGGVGSNGTIPSNTWTHVAATWDGATAKLYINGVLDNTATHTGTVGSNANLRGIGDYSPNSSGSFLGKIDELRIYDSVLSQAAVAADMVSTSATSANLIGYYNFDSISGNILIDKSTSNFNGTVINGPTLVESYAMVVPSASAATAVSATGFTANWAVPSTGTVDNGYRLDVSTSSTFASFVSGYNGLNVGNVTTFAVTGLSAGTTYYYRVRADKTSVSGQGANSNIFSTATAADSSNANLSTLSISPGVLSPLFASGTTTYTANVSNATTGITITPTKSEANAIIKVRVNGGGYAIIASGSPSTVSLDEGINTVDVTLTAQDGITVKIYTMTVTRGLVPPMTNFNNITKKYFDGSYTIVAPLSNSSGLLSYTSSDAAVATISGTTVTINGAGSATITATQAGDAIYNSGNVTYVLTVAAVSVLTKSGGISTTDTNYVNKNGGIGTGIALSASGAIVNAKTAAAAAPVLTGGLVMHLDAANSASYPGIGTIWTDLSGSNNNGTLINGPSYNSANGGNLVFNGTSQYVSATVTKATSCTFSVWAKSISANSNNMLFTAGNDGSGPDIYFSSGQVSWNTWDGAANTFGGIPATASNGNWHNYVVVNDAVTNTAKLYYDGVLYGTAVYKDASTNNKLYIGGNASNLNWNGAIGNFQVHNRVLTPSEVVQNFDNLKTRYGL